MKKLLLFLLLVPIIGFAKIYQWTDSNGSVHFSDKPVPGANVINLPETPVYNTPNVKQGPAENATKELQPEGYSFVGIEKPNNEETIRNNEGATAVSIALRPDLQPGNAIQLIVDGAPLGEPQESLIFELKELKRGSHTLAVDVVDSNGAVIISSDPITIFVHRPRVNMVPRAP